MEGAHARVHHRDAVLATGLLDLAIPIGTARLRDVANAVALRVVDVVAERDVAVGNQGDTIYLFEPALALVGSEGLGAAACRSSAHAPDLITRVHSRHRGRAPRQL